MHPSTYKPAIVDDVSLHKLDSYEGCRKKRTDGSKVLLLDFQLFHNTEVLQSDRLPTLEKIAVGQTNDFAVYRLEKWL
jgi:hypothetical protein